jgi:Ser/Thr protein kinase RdoA (MazF antagonist)
MTTTDDVKRLLQQHYDLGEVVSVTPHTGGMQVSNQHFVAATKTLRFFVKCVTQADALLGAHAHARLETVSAALVQLAGLGVHIERPMPRTVGAMVTSTGGTALRVFDFLDGRACLPMNAPGRDEDVRAAAAAVAQLHRVSLSQLHPATASAMTSLPFPYALALTAPRLDELIAAAKAPPTSDPAHVTGWQALAKHAPVVRDAVQVALSLPSNSAQSLVHLDFHPDNVWFSKSGAVIIDCDSMMVGPTHKCSAFSILRFGVDVETWRQASGSSEDTASYARAIHRTMVLIEVEKVLRICARALDTSAYQHFLPAVAQRHIPALRRLLSEAPESV